MNKYMSLSELPVGCSGCVASLGNCDSMRRRLLDLGLIDGTSVECVQKSPLGDPVAYLIRGAVIALRNEDSKDVMVNLS